MIGKVAKTLTTLRHGLWMIHESVTVAPAQESSYRHLFLRDLARLNIVDNFYPVGAAANYGLLYLLLRCAKELPLARVLEFGAGQTTLLLHELAAALGTGFTVTTVEHDPFWADASGGRTGRPLVSAPLVPARVGAHAIRWYDPAVVAGLGGGFDLVVVDGPAASTRADLYDRLGFAELVPNLLARNCVVIVDDAHRPGEAALVDACRERLQGWADPLAEGAVMAAKRQHVFACGAYAKAAFF